MTTTKTLDHHHDNDNDNNNNNNNHNNNTWHRFEPNLIERPTFADHFHHFVLQEPQKSLLHFLNDSGHLLHSLTASMLDAAAIRVAQFLLSSEKKNLAGDRIILLCDPGVDFVVSFFGVLYAGMIAVPSYPPMNEKQFRKLFMIGKNCRAKTVLMSGEFYRMMHSALPELERELGMDEPIQWLSMDHVSDLSRILSCASTKKTVAVDEAATLQKRSDDLQWIESIVRNEFVRPEIQSGDVAFLQYTSGSTSDPKGVMVTHQNILLHTSMICRVFEYSGKDTSVTWLPPYHDMGLIGSLLTAAACLTTTYVLSPLAFVNNPIVWLQTVTKYKATITGGPNFGYEYCALRVSEAQLAQLDLSTLRLCYTGAEPIRLSTMQHFSQKFASVGFRFDTFYPCYGLAEATLMVSGKLTSKELIKHIRVEQRALQANKIKLLSESSGDDNQQILVSSGNSSHIQPVKIVNAETRTFCKNTYEIGEIWVQRNGQTPIGYWANEQLTEESFYARTSDENDQTEYMRTGDLGFVDEQGALFVCGRIKDLIVIRGRNIYPQDVEAVVENSSPLVRNGCSAAFSVEHNACERLVVVCEVKDVSKQDTENIQTLSESMVKSISDELQVRVSTIIFIKPKTIPKTTSGKIRRFECKQLFNDQKLEVIATMEFENEVEKIQVTSDDAVKSHEPASFLHSESHLLVVQQLVSRLAQTLNISEDLIDINRPFSEMGLDSLKTSLLIGELGKVLNRELSPIIFYQFPTINSLADHLCANQQNTDSSNINHQKYGPMEDIAIVGMSCRLPGADNLEQFWTNLLSGTNAPSSLHPKYRRSSFPVSYIDNAFQFDPEFFSISRRETKSMDPQQRILLEVCWEALEDAGVSAEVLNNSDTGVFVGASSSDFALESYKYSGLNSAHSATGAALSILANRLSYSFNLRGPSMVLDSACSSSLLAVHQACQSIRAGDCSMALAAGVNLVLADTISQSLVTANFLSSDGQCKAFDAEADGYVRGEGCGVVVLKPLSRALSDNDQVYALIKGSAVVQDGRSNGLTAPNEKAQELVISEACKRANVDPAQITFVECHGTGTYLGDPIEAQALGSIVGKSTREVPCIIGSVKSNIGHLEAASGIASLIKTALAVQSRRLPATVNLKTPNPLIPFDKYCLELARIEHELPEQVIAGVSNFGFGGTNVHAILASAPKNIVAKNAVVDNSLIKQYVFPFSAKNEHSLKHLVGKYINFLQNAVDAGDSFLSNLSYSLCIRRTHLPQRICICASNTSDLTQELKKYRNGKDSVHMKKGFVASNSVSSVVFVFPGQGVDQVSHAKFLLSNPVFHSSIKTIERAFQELVPNISFEHIINNYEALKEDLLSVQSSVFAVQVALSSLWTYLGVTPSALIGHSLGEITAAYLGGALTLQNAVRIIYSRSIVMQKKLKGRGKMIIARLSKEAATEIVQNIEGVSIAAVNSTRSITFAVDIEQVAVMNSLLSDNSVSHKYLDMDYAFHCPRVDEVTPEFLQLVRDVNAQSLQIPIYSTTKGVKLSREDGKTLTGEYWVKNMVNPVLFETATQLVLQEKRNIGMRHLFIEVAGREVLSPVVQQIIHSCADSTHKSVATVHKSSTELHATLFASLYASGVNFNWERALGATLGSEYVRLPNYSWLHSAPFVPAFINKNKIELESEPLNVNDIVEGIKTEEVDDFESMKEFGLLLDNICIAYILCALVNMGWSDIFKQGNIVTLDQVMKELAIHSSHASLFTHIMHTLEKNNFLNPSNVNTWQIMKTLTSQKHLTESIEHMLQQGRVNFPTFLAEFNMIERSGKELHNVLQGKVNGLQILFPNGSMDNTEALYERSALSEAYNNQVCLFFERAMATISTTAGNSRYKQKILEIGAGTGGLTSHVLETLSAENLSPNNKDLRTATIHEYVFTDVSKLFLSYARQKFSACSYMKYQLLDVEKSPSVQGFKKHYYDFVLAANVLHATMNLHETLKNIKELLKPGGVLVILEVTKPTLFLDLTFGLLDGWWRFSQHGKQDMRDSYPLLSWSEWSLLLTEAGFANVNRISSQISSAHAIEEEFQSVMIAQLLEIQDEDNDDQEDELSASEVNQAHVVGDQFKIDDSTFENIKRLIEEIKHDRSSAIALNTQLLQFVRNVVSQTLMIPESDLDIDQSLDSLGLDSLMGLEIRNLLQNKLDVKIPISALIGEEGDGSGITIASLTQTMTRAIMVSEEPIESEQPDDKIVEQSQEEVSNGFSDAVEEIVHNTASMDSNGTKACILAMGVATPKYKYTQKEMAEMAVDYYGIESDEDKKQRLYKIFDGSEIDTRYSVCDFSTINRREIFTSFQARNQIYETEAVELAVQSATKALEDWGGDRSNITHIVSVSTTGNKIPGIEFELVHRLGLSKHVERIAVNFMGCFGALPGLKTAVSFAQMNCKNRVLFVSTEICSTHIEPEPTTENFVSCAIFADGSAAAIIGCGDPEFDSFERPHFEVLKTTSFAIQNSLDKMYWKVTDAGWRLGLSKDIPDLIFNNIETFSKEMLGARHGSVANIPKLDADWAVHPGGKAILIAVEKALGLTKEQTKHSWSIMKDRGNMSSSTILHVLQKMIKEERENSHMKQKALTCCMVFGPGLTMEGCILRRLNNN